MKIAYNNTRARIYGANEEQLDWLDDYLAIPDARAYFKAPTAVRSGSWDGKLHLLKKDASFPAGLVPTVARVMAAEAALSTGPIDVLDERVVPPADWRDLLVPTGWLDQPPYEFQRDAWRAALEKTRGIIKLPPGTGKTQISAAVMATIRCPWIFVVKSKDLMRQGAARFEKLTGEKPGIVGDSEWRVERVTFCTFQTLYRALKTPHGRELLAAAGGVFGDECHTASAESFAAVIMAMPNAYWRFGLSATPMARGDKRGAIAVGALGPVIYNMPGKELVARGVLAEATIYFTTVEQEESERPTFQGVYSDLVVTSTKRNRALVDVAKRAAKPALLFVKQQKHGKTLTKMLQRAKLNAEFVWGASSTERRQEMAKRLMRGEIDVIVCSVIWEEGVDLPALRSVIVGAAGKSQIAAVQRVGRGARIAEGKQTFEVHDVLDAGDPWLEGHSKARRSAYKREGWKIVEQEAQP